MAALESILSQEVVQRLGWTLVHFIWQAAAIALLLAILLATLRKASANLRYAVACLALALIVLMPIVTIQLVPVSSPEPPVVPPPPARAPVVLPIAQVSELPPVEAPTIEPPAPVETTISPPAIPWSRRVSEKLEPALPHVVSAWLIGVLALSVWHLGGWTQLQRLRRNMVKPVDASLRARLDALAEGLGVRQAVQLAESALVQIPTVVGWLRPVILLPASALTGLSPEQLEAIVAHELAHVRRHDYLVNMLQTVVETLGFYHPAVWWVSHKIRTERENCCDDLAVGISGNRIAYARALATMEEIRSTRSELAVAASGGNLFSRIRRLAGKESHDCGRVSWMPSAIVMLVIATIAVPIALALTNHNATEDPAQLLLGETFENHSRGKTPDPNEPQKLFLKDGEPDATAEQNTLYPTQRLDDRFELGRDITIELDAGPVGMRRIVQAKSVRFDKIGSEVRATLRAEVRRGLGFQWKTEIELLGNGSEVLGRRDSLNRARSLVSGQPVIEERMIEFTPFERNEVAGVRRFRLSFEQTGVLRDEIGRAYDDTRTDWIRGRVTGPDGQPVSDAIVLISEHKAKGGPFRVPRVGTDETGRYRLGAVDWPYRIGVERRQRLNSTNVDCYQVMRLKQIFNGPQTFDFKFDEPPKGAASLIGRAVGADGVPIRQFTANVSQYRDPDDANSESADSNRSESVWYNQEVHNENGEFRLEDVPAGKYRVRITSKEKQYERYFQEVVLADGKAINLTLTIPSKNVLYGRVLFEDGRPAVLKPAPWPGAETRILLPMGSRARGVAVVEEDGYFTVYLSEAEFERLKSRPGQLVINVPIAQQGRHGSAGKFPFELLATEKDKAGTVRVTRPAMPESEAQPSGGRVTHRPLVAKSPILTGENKPHIRVDCRVLEIYTSMKLDRETIIAAQNLLPEGTQPMTSGKSAPTVKELIGRAAATTLAIGEHSIVTTHGQTTRKMIDLLASRGAVKILSSPTLEVADGGKARVSSTQKVPMNKPATPSSESDRTIELTDYIEITPRILDDGNIKLLSEGTIHTHIPHQDNNQPPAIKSSSFSSEAVIEPGTSLAVVSGTKETEAEAGDTEEPQTEILFVLTPTVVDDEKPQGRTSEDDRQEKEPSAKPVPMLTKSPKQPAPDAASVKVGCFALEIPHLPESDRDIAREARKILGDRISVSPDGIGPGTYAARLLKGIIAEPRPVEEDWGREIRVTQEELEALIKVLASKGYIRILMNPTIQVADGQTAELKTGPNSFRVTAQILDDDYVSLQANVALRSESQPTDAQQKPMVGMRDVSSAVRLRPGTAAIIGGTQIARNPAESNSTKGATELLCILTATQIEPEQDAQYETDASTQFIANGEYETVQLGFADAHEVAGRIEDALRQMPDVELDQRLLLQPLERARQIIIFGQKDIREIVKKLIAELNIPAGVLETRAFKLKYVDSDLIKKRIEVAYEHSEAESRETVRVISFPAMKQVTVIASPQNLSKITELIAEWDTPLNLERVKPRIMTLQNSDPKQMTRLLTTLFAEQGGQGVSIYEVLFGRDIEKERKTFGPSSHQLTFEDVPGTKKIIIISNFPEAYDIVGALIIKLDKQNMTTKDLEQVREWITRLVGEGRLGVSGESVKVGRATDLEVTTTSTDKDNVERPLPATTAQEGEIHLPKNWREIAEQALDPPDDPLDPDSVNAQVYRRLQRIVSLPGLSPAMSFGKVIETLEQAAEPPLEIQPNWKDLLETAGIEPTTASGMAPVTNITLGKALGILLAHLSSDSAKVTYVVDAGVIVIATKKALPSKMVIRVYDITDLVGEPGVYRFSSMTGSYDWRYSVSQTQSLVKHIKERIAPESWFGPETGSEGTITPFPRSGPKKLAIYNTANAHRQIQRLLEKIRSGEEKLSELSIHKTEILIETRILTATDDFLKENRLDANSVPLGGIRSADGRAPVVEPNSLPFCLLLDDLQVNQLLGATRTPAGRGAKVLAAPHVFTSDGRPAIVKIVSEALPVPSADDPNGPSGKAESRPQRVEIGTTIKVTPDLLPDGNNVKLDFEWEHSQLRGYEQRVGPDGGKQKFPMIARDNISTVAVIPDGKTLLIGGKRMRERLTTSTKIPVLGDLPLVGFFFRRVSTVQDTRNVLILVKPTVNPKTTSPPMPPPLSPDDPLAEKLQGELGGSAALK